MRQEDRRFVVEDNLVNEESSENNALWRLNEDDGDEI